MESTDFVDEINAEDLESVGTIKLVSDLTNIHVVRQLIKECGGFCIYIPQKRNFKEALKRWLVKTNKVHSDPNYVVYVSGISKDSASKLLKELRGEIASKKQISMFETPDQSK